MICSSRSSSSFARNRLRAFGFKADVSLIPGGVFLVHGGMPMPDAGDFITPSFCSARRVTFMTLGSFGSPNPKKQPLAGGQLARALSWQVKSRIKCLNRETP